MQTKNSTLDTLVGRNTPSGSRIEIVRDFSGESTEGTSPPVGVGLNGIGSGFHSHLEYASNGKARDLAQLAALAPLMYGLGNRRDLLKLIAALGGAYALEGCAHKIQNTGARANDMYILTHFSDHASRDYTGKETAKGIDFQFDGKAGHVVTSPTWGWIIDIKRIPGRTGLAIETTDGLIYGLSGFERIPEDIVENTFVTPATNLGTEGSNTQDWRGKVPPVHTHIDIKGHTLWPKSPHQEFTVPTSKQVYQIYNPHDHSETGNALTPYDGRKRTIADIVGDDERILDGIGHAYRGDHVGDLITESKNAGLRFTQRLEMLYKAIEFGLVTNPSLRENLTKFFEAYKRRKGGFFAPYQNPNLVKAGVYDNQVYFDPTWRSKADAILQNIVLADNKNQLDEMIRLGDRLREVDPINDEIILSWHLARANQKIGAKYNSKTHQLRALAFWLSALGQSEYKWAEKFGSGNDPLEVKKRFTWQAYELSRRIYSVGLRMPEVAQIFAKRVAELNYTGPK